MQKAGLLEEPQNGLEVHDVDGSDGRAPGGQEARFLSQERQISTNSTNFRVNSFRTPLCFY